MLIKSKTEAFFLSLNVASFFFYDTNMFACGKQKKNLDITSAKEKMFSETVFGRKKILFPFVKQIVCFHLNVFSVVYCVYCCIVS